MRPRMALCLTMLLGACSGEMVSGTLGPGPSGVEAGAGGGGSVSVPTSLQGSWLRTVSFYGTDGSLHVSETRWTFSSDGSATRVVTSSNVTFGISDAVITTARWRVERGLLVIDYLSPTTGTARFAWQVQELTGGTQLVLDGQVFARVPV